MEEVTDGMYSNSVALLRHGFVDHSHEWPHADFEEVMSPHSPYPFPFHSLLFSFLFPLSSFLFSIPPSSDRAPFPHPQCAASSEGGYQAGGGGTCGRADESRDSARQEDEGRRTTDEADRSHGSGCGRQVAPTPR